MKCRFTALLPAPLPRRTFHHAPFRPLIILIITLALSSANYPVTPGDTFRLSYFLPSGVDYSGRYVVDSGYELQLGQIGTIEAEGLRLSELQRTVEDLVSRRYPMAHPRFDLVRVGLFRVFVSGAVRRAGWIEAWGCRKLYFTTDIRRSARMDKLGGLNNYFLLKKKY